MTCTSILGVVKQALLTLSKPPPSKKKKKKQAINVVPPH